MAKKGLDQLRQLKCEQSKSFHFDQATHNYRKARRDFDASMAAESAEDEFFDWVITVSFYSALHYFRAAICIDGSCKFYDEVFEDKSFEEVLSHRRKNPDLYPEDAANSPHEVLKRIVLDSYPSVTTAYHQLHSAAQTARYMQFRTATEENARNALEKLDKIRDWFNATYAAWLSGRNNQKATPQAKSATERG